MNARLRALAGLVLWKVDFSSRKGTCKMPHSTSSLLENISPEVLLNILQCLSLDSLLSLRCTSKALDNLIANTPELWQDISIPRKLKGKVTDVKLVEIGQRAKGGVRTIDLEDCPLLSGMFLLSDTMTSNLAVRQLRLKGCPRLSGAALVTFVRTLMEAASALGRPFPLRHLFVTGCQLITSSHLKELHEITEGQLICQVPPRACSLCEPDLSDSVHTGASKPLGPLGAGGSSSTTHTSTSSTSSSSRNRLGSFGLDQSQNRSQNRSHNPGGSSPHSVRALGGAETKLVGSGATHGPATGGRGQDEAAIGSGCSVGLCGSKRGRGGLQGSLGCEYCMVHCETCGEYSCDRHALEMPCGCMACKRCQSTSGCKVHSSFAERLEGDQDQGHEGGRRTRRRLLFG